MCMHLYCRILKKNNSFVECNLHTIKCSLFKSAQLVGFRYIQSCAAITTVLENFYCAPKENSYPLAVTLRSLLPRSLATTGPLSVPMNLPVFTFYINGTTPCVAFRDWLFYLG